MKEWLRYGKWALTAFVTVCAILVFYDTFYQSGALGDFLQKAAMLINLFHHIEGILNKAVAVYIKRKGKPVGNCRNGKEERVGCSVNEKENNGKHH